MVLEEICSFLQLFRRSLLSQEPLGRRQVDDLDPTAATLSS